MKNLKFIITPKMLFAHYRDRHIPMKRTDPLFKKVLRLLTAGKEEKAAELLFPAKRIMAYSNNEFSVDRKGVLRLHGDRKPVHKLVAEKLIQFSKDGSPYRCLIALWNNLKQNPDPKVVTDGRVWSIKDQLYGFIMKNNLPITEDGYFVCYRAVRRNSDGQLVDKATGTFINNVGQTVRMKRKDCDPNPNETCSRGLHGASHNYAQNIYGNSGDTLIGILVNPRDVVAVPTDYDQQKMRMCQYLVFYIDAKEIKKLYIPNSFIVNKTKEGLKKNEGFSFANMSSREIVALVKGVSGEDINFNLKSKRSIVKEAERIFNEKKLLAA